MSDMAATIPYLVMREKELRFAIACDAVREIVRLPPVAGLPLLPSDVRGVVNLRGEVFPLVDLRLRLGLPSSAHEVRSLHELFATHERDHQQWVADLVASVDDDRPFTRTRDPHACAFGTWYDQYEPTSRALATVLKRFEAPHRRIHECADHVEHAKAVGDAAEARRLAAHARDVLLPAMERVFADARAAVEEEQRELAVILARAGDFPQLALTVDGVDSVERLSADQIEGIPPSAVGMESFVLGVAKVGDDQQLIYLLDPDAVRMH